MVEARGLANSATKTVIALSRGSKIKTYRTCAPMWNTRPVWPPSQNLSANRTRLAGAGGWPRRGAALSLIWRWRWRGVLEGELAEASGPALLHIGGPSSTLSALRLTTRGTRWLSRWPRGRGRPGSCPHGA